MENLQYRSGAINASDCVGQAWELVKRNFGLYLGGGLIVLIFISCIPFVNFFLIGPMMGGFAYIVLRDLRNEPVDFGMLFKGFEKFVPLMVVGLIQAIPAILFQIFQWVINFASLVAQPPSSGDADFYQAADPAFSSGLILVIFGVVFGYLFLQIAWNIAFSFAIPLVLDKDASVGEALSLNFRAVFSNLGGLLVLFILSILVGLLGYLALCFGIFVAMPVIWAANVVAYRMVFPDLRGPSQYSGPPPPTVYDGTFGRGQ